MSKRYIQCYVCLWGIVLTAIFVSIIIRGINRGILKNENWENVCPVNWEERYPFEEQPEAQAVMAEISDAIGVDYLQLYNKAKNSLNWYCTEGFYGKRPCIEITGWLNQTVGNHYIQDKTVVADIGNGYFVTTGEAWETEELANNVVGFHKFLEEESIPFLYVESLYKIERGEPHPFCYDNHVNENADDLVSHLKPQMGGILDLRDCTEAQGNAYRELFFKTDSHWKPETALWAAKKIAEKMNDMESDMAAVEEIKNMEWEQIILENAFMGGFGRGNARAEDFTVIYPKNDTSYHYIAPSIGLDSTGRFEEVLIDWSVLTGDNSNSSAYASYMYDRQHYAEIINLNCSNDTTLLFLSDSFGSTTAPFLSLGVKRIIFIDPRLFAGSIECVVKQEEPDFVVAMYNPETIMGLLPDSNDNIYMLR